MLHPLPNHLHSFFDNQNNTMKRGFPWLRGFPVPFQGISDRSRPEEVDSDGLKSGTVPHRRKASDPESLDPRSPVILGHGRLYTGPPPILVLKLRTVLLGPALGNSHRLLFIAKIMVLLAWLDRTGFCKRTLDALRGVKSSRVSMLLVFDLDRGMSLRAKRDLAPLRKAKL